MEPQQALPQFTSYALRETSRFLRHLANACDRLEQTGSLPPTLFAAQVPQQGPRPPPPAAGYGVGPDSAQPIFSQPAASPGSMPSPPRPQKRRKAEKRTRAPTGYNVFVQQKLESLKQQGLYSQFSDSKAAFKAAVEEWRNLPEQVRQKYLDDASQAAKAAKQEEASLPTQELEEVSRADTPSGGLSQPSEPSEPSLLHLEAGPGPSRQQQQAQQLQPHKGRGQRQ